VTVATRTGFELEAAIESFRRNQRTRLASQTLDRLYIPRLNKLAVYLRAQGMPTNVGSIRREHLESYIEWLQHSAPGRSRAGQKSATVSISYRTIRFNWLVKEDELRKSPMDRVQAPAVVEEAPLVLTPPQLEHMYKACAGRGFEDRRDLALLRLLADSGMRRGEVAGLTVDDLTSKATGLSCCAEAPRRAGVTD
jgi:site-specific recombinase XerD